MRMLSNFTRLPLLALSLTQIFGCSSASDETSESVDRTGSPIIGGSVVTAAEQQLRGLIGVNGGCSGVMLSNEWALTAGHCLNFGPGNQNQNSVSISGVPNAVASDQIYMFGNANLRTITLPGGRTLAGLNGTPDIGVIHLPTALKVNGSTNGFSNPIDATLSNQLTGTTLAEYGQGLFTYASYSPNGTLIPPTGSGWHAANMTVAGTAGLDMVFSPNASQQVASFGDSGGPYIRWINGQEYVVAIQSTASTVCSRNPPAGTTCGVGNGQSYVTSITQAQAVSLGDNDAFIAAVFDTSWNANDSAQWIDVYPGEINGTPWAFSNVDAVSWAQAMRASTQLCYSRAFPAGHFTGHTVSPKVGLLCQGPGTVWADVAQSEINGTPEPFTDVNAIGWGQAQREAGILCVNRGYVSGHFDGQEANGTFGLICSNSNAGYYVASASDFAATGFPMGDVDQTAWGAAGRAASSYCSARGFVSGYINGQENRSNSTYGVICEK